MSDLTMSPPVGGQVYSTKQAAELTGVPEATIRSWKQRGKFDFSHNFKDDSGNTLWTETGLLEIQRLSGATVSNAATATDSNADTATLNDAATEDMGVLLAPLADAIALEVIRQQLPPAIRAAIQRLLTSTDANDQQRLHRLLEGMGLVLAQNALNMALQHAIATSQQSMKALGGGHE